ncbi:hypothetical protein BDC45DRAFT_575173 [Circinella umbellata]|nr:hypothetical protein BDC45DRAFT_575173 [Circinella umbellata]
MDRKNNNHTKQDEKSVTISTTVPTITTAAPSLVTTTTTITTIGSLKKRSRSIDAESSKSDSMQLPLGKMEDIEKVYGDMEDEKKWCIEKDEEGKNNQSNTYLTAIKDSGDIKRQQDCDHVIAHVIDQIRSYAVTLRPVISERIYFDLVSCVVDSGLTHLLGDIEDLQDIGAEDSHLIAQSLNSLIQLVDVFDSKDRGPRTRHRINGILWIIIDVANCLCLKKKELIGLICALFADTDLRASMIREIQSTDSSPFMLSPSTSASSPPIEQRQQERSTTPKTTRKEEENKSTVKGKYKLHQLSMRLHHNKEGESGEWRFHDNMPLIILQEDEDDAGCGDSDEDVNFDHVHLIHNNNN